ncbi:uncharacterized protein LOC127806261 [Diospyros lotus]|uniref:uncharacterized protein LOC127806261 n=1 Tax=Diospyros lotus TaxID=55363 RepID=UPI002258BC6A|nr:uncharacterized protein LOC127806261 [Diospyros lotus]
MAVSLNSILVFNSTGRYQHGPSSGLGIPLLKASHFTSRSGLVGLRRFRRDSKGGLCLSVADKDHVATSTSNKDSGNAERLESDDYPSEVALPSVDSLAEKNQTQTSAQTESGTQTVEHFNGSVVSPLAKPETASVNTESGLRRSPLTAREKLRAARVLSRYSESKPTKSELGSKVLEALRESDRGKKKSGLPEAPTNMFDDRKRGMPKQGLTFEFPGGFDVFLIIFSFTFISTVMFATTYIVWKVGAIHFNEY